MTAYIPIALVVLAFAAWAGYDAFYSGKPRPLWGALGLCLAGGFLGLFSVPALRRHPATESPLFLVFSTTLPDLIHSTLPGLFQFDWRPHAVSLFLAWLIADRILAASVLWNLWRRDRRLFQMTARQFEEFEKARQAFERHGTGAPPFP